MSSLPEVIYNLQADGLVIGNINLLPLAPFLPGACFQVKNRRRSILARCSHFEQGIFNNRQPFAAASFYGLLQIRLFSTAAVQGCNTNAETFGNFLEGVSQGCKPLNLLRIDLNLLRG